MDHPYDPNSFWLNPTNVSLAADNNTPQTDNNNTSSNGSSINPAPQQSYSHAAVGQSGETYFQNLRRTKKAGTVHSSDSREQFYHSQPHSSHNNRPQHQTQQHQYHDMSAAVLPTQHHHHHHHFSTNTAHAAMSLLPTSQQMYNIPSTSNMFAQPPKANTAPAQQASHAAPAPTGQQPSRFQQLLHKKLAAERNAAPTPSAAAPLGPTPLENAFAQAQVQSHDTVFHKEFASRHQHHTSGGYPQPTAYTSLEKPKSHNDVRGASSNITSAQQQQQQQHMFSNPPTSYPHVSNKNMGQQQVQHYQRQVPTPRRSSNGQHGDSASFDEGSMSAPGRANATTWSGQRKTSDNSFVKPYLPTQNSASSSSSSQTPASSSQASSSVEPLVKVEPQWMDTPGMNGWQASIYQNNPATVNYQQQQQQQSRLAPSFAWNVSEARSPNQDISSSLHPQFVYSPGQALPHPASSSPVSPTGPPRFGSAPDVNLPAPYTQIKVEPDTHLTVPYRPNSNPYPTPNSLSSSPLLEFGHRMFTNMNGSFQLPGSMYMASTSNGDGIPSTLANGMTGSNGGGSSGGHNGSDGWANGNGDANGDGSGNGDASGSGSGSGSGGNGDDGENGDDGGDDGKADGNGHRKGKPKKLTLACHFCRRRKLKCNGAHPRCDNCTKRNEICSWDDSVRRRGPGKATKERREKAAREAIAAGLTNSNSLTIGDPSGTLSMDGSDGHAHHGELPIADAIATLPVSVGFKDEHDHGHGHDGEQDHEFALDSLASQVVQGIVRSGGGGQLDNHSDIPIDPALAELETMAAGLPVPGTLAELEVKRAGKRKSHDDLGVGVGVGVDIQDGTGPGTGEKRLKVDGV